MDTGLFPIQSYPNPLDLFLLGVLLPAVVELRREGRTVSRDVLGGLQLTATDQIVEEAPDCSQVLLERDEKGGSP